MKRVILTDQSLDRLEESLLFYIDELGIPVEKVIQLKDQLLLKAKSLALQPYKGQYEPYLEKFNKGHRRIVN